MRIKNLEAFKETLLIFEKYKKISREFLIDAIKEAIVSAHLKTKGSEGEIEVDIDPETFNININRVKLVVEKVENRDKEISLEDAKKVNQDATLGDEILLEEDSDDFRRNAVQNAKQLIIQKLREAEKDNIIKKFKDKKGNLITGMISRVSDEGNVFVEIEGIETLLPRSEQSFGEKYFVKDIIKVYVVDVIADAKMPRVLISRKRPQFIEELFKFEVPEISEGIIQIVNVAREAGSRTKISVHSDSDVIDPVGATVGDKSSRIKAIINEVKGEKIDIINWSSDLEEYIRNALKPAEIEEVTIQGEDEDRQANIKVKENQLALAIGKKGRNARLAAKLVNCRINIEVLGG